MKFEDLKEGSLAVVISEHPNLPPVGCVKRVTSISENGYAYVGSDDVGFGSFYFQPWQPELDDQGRIIWPGGDVPLLEGEEAYVWFKSGQNWNEDKCKEWWADGYTDWDHSGNNDQYKITHFKPLGKAAERLLGSVESSKVVESSGHEIAVGDWVRCIDSSDSQLKYQTIYRVKRCDSVGVYVDQSGEISGAWFRNRFELYATAAEHQTYLATKAPEGVEKLPFNDGGWAVPVEGDSWVLGIDRPALQKWEYGNRPGASINSGKRVIVRKIEATSTANEPKEGEWIDWSGGEMPVDGDVLVQVMLLGVETPYDIHKAIKLGWGVVPPSDWTITSYRVLPNLPEGEEHLGEFRLPKKGERYWAGECTTAKVDHGRIAGFRWILKPQPSTDSIAKEAVELTEEIASVAEYQSTNARDVLEYMYQFVNLINQGDEAMSEVKTDEQLLAEAPTQIGYDRVVGFPQTGWFRRDLFFATSGEVKSGRICIDECTNEGRRVIYRKKKGIVGKSIGLAGYCLKRSAQFGGMTAIGTTFLVALGLASYGIHNVVESFTGYHLDADMVRSAIDRVKEVFCE